MLLNCFKTEYILLALVVPLISECVAAEAIDSIDGGSFCYPELHKNTRESCECSAGTSSPWGLRVVNIDCSFKNFVSADFSETLPLYADRLDLSWNRLERVPILSSDSLTQLNLMHNNITTIATKNFVKISNLHELYLNWNSIQVIEQHAFSDLAHLQVLDLSHNNLHNLAGQVFAPLQNLASLYLSWNRQLNETEGIQEVDFYQKFRVNNKLRSLKLKSCNLNNIVLPRNAALKELDLSHNLFKRMPPQLPDNLEILSVSENLFEALLETDTKGLKHLSEFYLEDMPDLKSIGENSLVPLTSLEKVSFQNSRNLATMHEFSFGQNATLSSSKLKSIIFRGTALRSFNSTLAPVFYQLATLDLNGLPLHCDCNLVWLQQLPINTNGRCFYPSKLRGISLSQVDRDDLSCEPWPRWANGLIILALIALCSIGIYLIVVGTRPNDGIVLRRKIGAGSPYARVTIEPNHQDHY